MIENLVIYELKLPAMFTNIDYSMLYNLISRLATCHIFWAADFVQYAEAAQECYTDITNITNYSVFKAIVDVAKHRYEGEILQPWYVNTFYLSVPS